MNFFANILESDLDRFKSIFEIYNKDGSINKYRLDRLFKDFEQE